MCNPLYDIQVEVSDEVLDRFGFAKGGMYLVEADRQRELVAEVYQSIVNTEAGGSGANTMSALAMLGSRTVFTGHVGQDEHAQMYREGLERRGVKANLGAGAGDTGICLVVVTPDTQRTMFTCLGASRELHWEDVDVKDIEASKYIYVTGYLWDTDTQKEAVTFAMEQAKQRGVKVALSLSDPFCVNRHKDDFRRLIRDHVDVLFGNDEEVLALTDTPTVEEGLRALVGHCDVVAVTENKKGSTVQVGDERHPISAVSITAVDTTGAGDTYAAGILHGLAAGWSAPECGRLASRLAAKVVAKMGPRLDDEDLADLAPPAGFA